MPAGARQVEGGGQTGEQTQAKGKPIAARQEHWPRAARSSNSLRKAGSLEFSVKSSCS